MTKEQKIPDCEKCHRLCTTPDIDASYFICENGHEQFSISKRILPWVDVTNNANPEFIDNGEMLELSQKNIIGNSQINGHINGYVKVADYPKGVVRDVLKVS